MTISAPQLGKTIIGGIWLLTAAWYGGKHEAPWWWAAPTYGQCYDGFVTKFCGMARSAGVLASNTESPPLKATLTNGAKIEARSWEKPGGMFGPTIRGGVVDEFGQLTKPAYSAISSRRAESVSWGEGMLRYLGNVGEIGGPAEDLWNQAQRGDPGFAYRRWTWRDRAMAHPCRCGENDTPLEPEPKHLSDGGHSPVCPRGIYCDFIAEEMKNMSGPQFRQLYGAEWVDWNQLPAYEFDRDVHVDPSVAFDPHLPLDVSCDFNVDPMAWILGQHHHKEAWAHDEIVIEGGATTAAACREVIRRYPDPKTHISIFGDATGRARGTRSNESDYDIILAALGSYYAHVESHVPMANPPVQSRLNAVNAKLKAADGTVTYRVHPRCEKLANDYARVSLKAGTHDLDKSNRQLTHASDADGYRIVSLYPIAMDASAEIHIPDLTEMDQFIDDDQILGARF